MKNKNNRFSSLKEEMANPFKLSGKQKRNKYTDNNVNNTNDMNNTENENNTKAYVPISKRNKRTINTNIDKSEKKNIFSTKSPKIEDVRTNDESVFPSLNDSKEIKKAETVICNSKPKVHSCWNSSTVDIVKSNKKEESIDCKEPIRPGWVRISKRQIVNGPPSTFNVEDVRLRTELIRYYEFLNHHRKTIMDDIELYGDEYYHKFGDPDELLNDDDSFALYDEDENSTGDDSSYDGYDRDSGAED